MQVRRLWTCLRILYSEAVWSQFELVGDGDASM
jgi:hypothetical protein